MATDPLALTLRLKKLGLLIRDARLARGKSLAECAELLGTSAEIITAYEFGETAPSLPELERLAYAFGIPVEHFLGNERLGLENKPRSGPERMALRHKLIGALLREKRMQAGLTLAGLADQIHIEPALLEGYELGETAVPVPVLEKLATALQCSFTLFQDRQGEIGAWLAQQRHQRAFMALAPETQVFISDPKNMAFLNLARQISEMPPEALRLLAESLSSAVHSRSTAV